MEINYVAKLNELTQRAGWRVSYEDVASFGPPHIKTFTIKAVVNGQSYPEGSGHSKKEARQIAAKHALKSLTEDQNDQAGTGSAAQISNANPPPIMNYPNYVSLLNDYGQKNKVEIKPLESTRLDSTNFAQCRFLVGEKQCPVASGKTKKEAKEEAAKLAYQEIFSPSVTQSSAHTDASEDGASESIGTQLDKAHIRDSKFRSTSSGMDRIVFEELSPKAEEHKPDVKSKFKIAANFDSPLGKEVAGKQSERRTQDHKAQSRSVESRFKSEYKEIALLDKGGFGRVFKAREKLTDKEYAIKIVTFKEKAKREVAALSDLSHTNIVRYYKCWTEDTDYLQEAMSDSWNSSQSSSSSPAYLYIQMELCGPKTLKSWIAERNSQGERNPMQNRRKDSLEITQQITCGVKYIHIQKLIHRDLKPQNIMFGRKGEVKIVDFGLVTEENDESDDCLLERTLNKGTPTYMAPEQKINNYDRKVDIYAMGLIYFELLWNIVTVHERKVIWEDVRSQKLPEGFANNFPQENQIIKSMLSLLPTKRPDAEQLDLALGQIAKALQATKLSLSDRQTV